MIQQKTFRIACAGYSVFADWYQTDNTDEIILSLIGWTSTRKKYNDILSAICAGTGKSALVFDYSGHGDSPLDISATRPAQHFLEVICVFDWLREKYPDAKITVMGASYGGFMATHLVSYRSFDNLILRVPAIYRASDFYTTQQLLHNAEGKARTDATRHDDIELATHPVFDHAEKFKGKTLVVIHEQDEQVPKETTDAYIQAFSADVYVAKDFPHSMGGQPREKITAYQNAIVEWLTSQDEQ